MRRNEIEYKLEMILEYLEETGGEMYKVYNQVNPLLDEEETDSNIIESCKDVIEYVKKNNLSEYDYAVMAYRECIGKYDEKKEDRYYRTLHCLKDIYPEEVIRCLVEQEIVV